MTLALPTVTDGPSGMRWSVYAGLYMFVCAALVALLLAPVLTLLADVIGLSAEYAVVAFASPALVVGAGVWLVLVERRNSHTYPAGCAFGFLTALLTGVIWTVRFTSVWGVEMLTAGPVAVLVLFVLAVASVAGLVTGLPLMYVRRRLAG